MYRDFVLNLSLVISFLTISGFLFRNKSWQANTRIKILGGFVAGVLGSLLMGFAIPVMETTLIDFRSFAVIIVTMYGGLVSGLIAATVIAINRVLFFGINETSLIAVIVIFGIALMSAAIFKQKLPTFMKFNIANVCNILLYFAAFTLLIKDKQILHDAYIMYGTYSFVGGLVVFYIADYIDRANMTFRTYKETAQTDYLTGLHNVRQFRKALDDYIASANKADEELSLLLLDIDFFKTVNDTYGHVAGDVILKDFAQVLRVNTRPFDFIGRVGGEEFAIILPDCPKERALQIAERIRQAVEHHDFPISDLKNEHVTLNITVSIGVSSYPDPIGNKSDLFKSADACLYSVKNAGRNRVTSC